MEEILFLVEIPNNHDHIFTIDAMIAFDEFSGLQIISVSLKCISPAKVFGIHNFVDVESCISYRIILRKL